MFVVIGLTQMHQGICMSVYDLELNCYLRPIPPTMRFSADDVENLPVFSRVELARSPERLSIKRPHTEDVAVHRAPNAVGSLLTTVEQQQFLNRIAVKSVHAVFKSDNNGPILQHENGRYFVVPGTGLYSLGTVHAKSVKVSTNGFGKVRVDFQDNSGVTYQDLPLVSVDNINPDLMTSSLALKANKYVRVSLSRPFQPAGWPMPACFLQVSGIHGY